jgi:hypothetical protein
MEDGGNKTTISPLDSAILISRSLMNESIFSKFNFKNSSQESVLISFLSARCLDEPRTI